jgi:hypothetical protein
MKYVFAFAALAAVAVSMPVFAADKVSPAVNASSKEAFETVSTWVRKQMDEGGRYSYVTSSEKSTVNAELDGMGKLLQQNGDVEHMNSAQKTQMFNSQEQVNAILAKRDNDRLICKNEKPIGSNIPTKTCQTAGSIEARRRNDVQYLQRTQNTPQQRGGN